MCVCGDRGMLGTLWVLRLGSDTKLRDGKHRILNQLVMYVWAHII